MIYIPIDKSRELNIPESLINIDRTCERLYREYLQIISNYTDSKLKKHGRLAFAQFDMLSDKYYAEARQIFGSETASKIYRRWVRVCSDCELKSWPASKAQYRHEWLYNLYYAIRAMHSDGRGNFTAATEVSVDLSHAIMSEPGIYTIGDEFIKLGLSR